MKKNVLLRTLIGSVLLSSSLFLSTAWADWQKDESNDSWYYLDDDGSRIANQTMMIDGFCYGFYGDGRLMRNDDITDVKLGVLNYYSSQDTKCTVSSQWGNYTIELPGNSQLLDYTKLAGRKPIYEFMAIVPASGTKAVSVSSSYFQTDKDLEDSLDEIIQTAALEKFLPLSSSDCTLGNGETYRCLSLVYDQDGVYGRPVYRDCYVRKIDGFCAVLTFEYEKTDTNFTAHLVEMITPNF